MTRELTCIVCPVGCSLKAVLNQEGKYEISGNTCKRGAEYAVNECTNPLRTITTTIRCSDGSVIPVKTLNPIPKDKIMDAMRIINNTITTLPIALGDVIIKDVYGSDVVATSYSM